jgi:hypothetical protein
MSRALLLVCLVCLVGLCPARASAETVDQAYSAALKHYYGGRYKEAVAGFQRVLAIPVENTDLHYNLGCAYFRLGEHGRAVYHFERALHLDPDAEDAAFNLQTVRALLAGKVKDELKGAMVDPFWMRAVRVMSAGGWGGLFLVLWWLTFAILFLLRFMSPGPARSGLVAANSFVALLALLCGLMLAGRVFHDHRVESGIVLPDTLAVREGPDPSTKTSFRLHAGLKVRVQAREGRWMRIRLPNGLEGWVARRDVGVL